MLDHNMLDGQTDRLKEMRREAVHEREEFTALKKQYGCKHAKAEAKTWLKRERALTLLIDRDKDSASVDEYHWPLELAESLDWALDRIYIE